MLVAYIEHLITHNCWPKYYVIEGVQCSPNHDLVNLNFAVLKPDLQGVKMRSSRLRHWYLATLFKTNFGDVISDRFLTVLCNIVYNRFLQTFIYLHYRVPLENSCKNFMLIIHKIMIFKFLLFHLPWTNQFFCRHCIALTALN